MAKKVDLNKLAQKLTKSEGGKESLSIGQVKEVMRLVIKELKALTVEELADVFKKAK